jgi:parallel beta-helix repeat protein
MAGAIALAGVLPEAGGETAPQKRACSDVLQGGGDLQRFVDRLHKGQTGCLAGGVHEGGVTLRKKRITLRSRPGQRATIRGGQVRIAATARRAKLTRLNLTTHQLSPLIYASKAVLSYSSITNENTASCVHIHRYPGARVPKGIRIEHNRIHDCGRKPATNYDHGIYIAKARNTMIRKNLIYDNADRGIQLYPNARGTKVFGNVIDRNGEGILFGGGTQRSVVARNIISNSNVRHNVESADSNSRNNMVRDNCLWSNRNGYYSGKPKRSGIMQGTPGFKVRNNKIRRPKHGDGYKRSRC